jgi:polyferredoxin
MGLYGQLQGWLYLFYPFSTVVYKRRIKITGQRCRRPIRRRKRMKKVERKGEKGNKKMYRSL